LEDENGGSENDKKALPATICSSTYCIILCCSSLVFRLLLQFDNCVPTLQYREQVLSREAMPSLASEVKKVNRPVRVVQFLDWVIDCVQVLCTEREA